MQEFEITVFILKTASQKSQFVMITFPCTFSQG